MKLRVMAVDDDSGVLSLLKLQLESLGCEVLGVQDSREAAKRLKEEKVDGLFVDVLMPHVDGFHLTQEARLSKLNRRIPIIMLTAMDDAETMRKGFDSGANFFLGKPFTRERVYNLLGATRGPMVREKQRYARLSYRTPVDCTWGSEPQKRLRTSSEDISEGGMMLTPAGALAVAQELEVVFSLPNTSRSLRARAVVAREAAPNAVGIQFLKLSEDDQTDLLTYISARLEK